MVKWRHRDPKIGMESCFGSNSMVEFDSKIPKIFTCPTKYGQILFHLKDLCNFQNHEYTQIDFLVQAHDNFYGELIWCMYWLSSLWLRPKPCHVDELRRATFINIVNNLSSISTTKVHHKAWKLKTRVSILKNWSIFPLDFQLLGCEWGDAILLAKW